MDTKTRDELSAALASLDMIESDPRGMVGFPPTRAELEGRVELTRQVAGQIKAAIEAALSKGEGPAVGVEWRKAKGSETRSATVNGYSIGRVFPVTDGWLWTLYAGWAEDPQVGTAPTEAEARACVEASFRSALASLTGGAVPSREGALTMEGYAAAPDHAVDVAYMVSEFEAAMHRDRDDMPELGDLFVRYVNGELTTSETRAILREDWPEAIPDASPAPHSGETPDTRCVRSKHVSEMTNDELAAELARVDGVFDEMARDDFGMGGSPREALGEYAEDIESEMKARGLPVPTPPTEGGKQ